MSFWGNIVDARIKKINCMKVPKEQLIEEIVRFVVLILLLGICVWFMWFVQNQNAVNFIENFK
jgi:hypothetical protein